MHRHMAIHPRHGYQRVINIISGVYIQWLCPSEELFTCVLSYDNYNKKCILYVTNDTKLITKCITYYYFIFSSITLILLSSLKSRIFTEFCTMIQ